MNTNEYDNRTENALCFSNRSEWREWLKQNHTQYKEAWLVYRKKKSKLKGISYNEAVEEALCFGWIDSIVKSIDKDSYMQKFTPRNARSVWSESNKLRVKKMTEAGMMTVLGLKSVETAKAKGTWDKSYGNSGNENEIPGDLLEALEKNKTAKINFINFAKGYQQTYIKWINFAKKIETRKKRIQKIIEFAEKNIKPGMM
jgi:uncharacterized protein YdeI (YjbR/CyaY-like superfamily)